MTFRMSLLISTSRVAIMSVRRTSRETEIEYGMPTLIGEERQTVQIACVAW